MKTCSYCQYKNVPKDEIHINTNTDLRLCQHDMCEHCFDENRTGICKECGLTPSRPPRSDFNTLQSWLSNGGLTIRNETTFKPLTQLMNPDNIRSLTIMGCESTTDVENYLNIFTKLEKIRINYSVIPNLTFLLNNTGIRDVHFDGLNNLQNVDCLTNLTRLEQIQLSNMKHLKQINGLSNLKTIKSCTFTNNKRLENINGLKNCSSLTSLDIYSCPKITNLDCLKNLQALNSLSFFCDNRITLPNIPSLKILNTHAIDEKQNLKDVVPNIESVEFRDKFITIKQISDLQKLTDIHIQVSDVCVLDPLLTCPILKTITLRTSRTFDLSWFEKNDPSKKYDVSLPAFYRGVPAYMNQQPNDVVAFGNPHGQPTGGYEITNVNGARIMLE
jgi:hypothetical protein